MRLCNKVLILFKQTFEQSQVKKLNSYIFMPSSTSTAFGKSFFFFQLLRQKRNKKEIIQLLSKDNSRISLAMHDLLCMTISTLARVERISFVKILFDYGSKEISFNPIINSLKLNKAIQSHYRKINSRLIRKFLKCFIGPAMGFHLKNSHYSVIISYLLRKIKNKHNVETVNSNISILLFNFFL